MRKKQDWLSICLVGVPLLVCALIMVPRLASAQFGLLDDGTTIATSQKIAEGKWSLGSEIGAGRFRPAYWLYYGLIYLIAGPSAQAYFIGNLLLFVAITAGLILLVRLNGGSLLAAGLAGLFFVLSGPVIENFYTLSKPEAPQVLGLILVLIAIHGFSRSSSRITKAFLLVTALLAMALVISLKETGLAMLPISLIWLGIAWLTERRRPSKEETGSRLVMVGVVLVISVAYLALRAAFITLGLPGGGYSSNYAFTFQRFFTSAYRWAGWLVRDYLYLVPLALFLIIFWFKQRTIPFGHRYLEWLVWMVVWIAVYLPWIYSLEYYLLPFALGCAAFCGLAVDQMVRLLATVNHSVRLGLAACLVSTFLLLALTVPNNVTNARLQLTVDAANAEMLEYITQNLPQNASLLINLPQGYEYYNEIDLQLGTLYHRPDILVQRFPFQSVENEQKMSLPYTIISPQIKNPPQLSVRLGVNEGISSMGNKVVVQWLGPKVAPELKIERRYRLFTIDFLHLACPLLKSVGYCAASNTLIDQNWLSYGWTIYTVTNHPQNAGAQ
jgi:hypothetical protein